MRIAGIETPAILIDLDIMEANLDRVAEYARAHHLRLRPHTKTHKIPELGRRQMESGAAGLTVAKVGEAEVMLASGTPDLLVAYPIIGRNKLARLMEVARHTRVTVGLDNMVAARQLSDAAREAQIETGVLAEADVGQGRVGVPPGPELVELARSIMKLPHLKFLGVTFYPGHIRNLDEQFEEHIHKLSHTADRILEDFQKADVPVEVVSGGSTPTLYHSHRIRGLTEIRPGTYIFNDSTTVEIGACGWQDCAASILCTVVSTARPGQIILDGGSKAFSSDRSPGPGEPSYGHIPDAPGAVFHKMNEEHGYVDVRRCGRQDFQVGDRLRVIPNHICVAMNLHEQVYGIRGGQVETVWKVEGRGKLQ